MYRFPDLYLPLVIKSFLGEPDGSQTTYIPGKVGIGIGNSSPTQALDVSGNVTADAFVGNGVTPIGGIIMWSGAIDLATNSPQDTNGVVHLNWRILWIVRYMVQ